MCVTCGKIAIFVCMLCLALGGCAQRASRAMVADMVAQGQFGEQRFSTSSFVLYGLLRPARDVRGDNILHVYVEGDGVAWASARRPSQDPTPDTPVVLSLASADPTAGPVLYLARPCQYVRDEDARQCRTEYWTSGRLSETVIRSLNEAVDMAKNRSGARRVVLVGYSGGGGAVALMAAQRGDVVFLGTVAGLLDHAAWTTHHGVSPLRTSLNPVDSASRLRELPQRHVGGAKDVIVPPEVNEAFCQAVGAALCVTVPGFGHDGPWERVWEYEY